MAEVELLHRVYTSAASGGWDTTGARFVTLEDHDASVLPPEVLAGVDDLLRKITPASTETAWVVGRFAAERGSYACLAASYPDLVFDIEDRSALLNHARIVRVSGDEAWSDVPALVETAQSFPLPDVCATAAADRLAAFLNFLAVDPCVTIRPVSLVELQQLPRPFLTAVLIACVGGAAKRQKTRFALPAPGRDLLEGLALAWTALPIGLQRSNAWAVAVGDGCAVDAIFSTSEGTPAAYVGGDALVDCVNAYVDMLLDSPLDIGSVLRDPKLSTANELNAFVRRATVAGPMLGMRDGESSGKAKMAKKEKGPRAEAPSRGREDADPLSVEKIAELNRQYAAMEERLRLYVDQRLATWEARQGSRSPESKGSSELKLPPEAKPPSERDRPQASRSWISGVAVVAFLVIAIGLFLLFRTLGSVDERRRPEQSSDDLPRSTPVDPLPQEPVPYSNHELTDGERRIVQRAVTAATGNNDWGNTLKDLISNDGPIVNEMVLAAADGSGLSSGTVTSEARADLGQFATRIRDKDTLSSEDRERLRALLLDYIAARATAPDAAVVVDGKLDDVGPHLERLKQQYAVTTPSKQPSNMPLQSEIILRWMGTPP